MDLRAENRALQSVDAIVILDKHNGPCPTREGAMSIAHVPALHAVQVELAKAPPAIVREFEPALTADTRGLAQLDSAIAAYELMSREQARGLRAAINTAWGEVEAGHRPDTPAALDEVIDACSASVTEVAAACERAQKIFSSGVKRVPAAARSKFKRRAARGMKAMTWRHNQFVDAYYSLVAMRAELEADSKVTGPSASTPDEVAALFAEMRA